MAQFQKGQSGNPGGRPAGATKLRTRIYTSFGDDGKKLVDALMLIATGSQASIQKKYGAKADIRDRREAIKELLDRGWGKTPQSIELEGKGHGTPIPVRVVFGGRHRADGTTSGARE